MSLGTMWIDEAPWPVVAIELRNGRIEFVCRLIGPMTIEKGHHDYHLHDPSGVMVLSCSADLPKTRVHRGQTVSIYIPIVVEELLRADAGVGL